MLRPVMKATSLQSGSINVGTHSVHISFAKKFTEFTEQCL